HRTGGRRRSGFGAQPNRLVAGVSSVARSAPFHQDGAACSSYQPRGRLRPGPIPPHPVEVSAELLGQSDDDALRASQEAQPVAVLVLRDLADEFATVAAQAF